jgi:hypothetical protein
MDIRILDEPDQILLETFLRRHRDSSMFLRANARSVGLADRPEPLHALYVAAIENSHIAGVVAHSWNGMLLIQCPDGVEVLVRSCVNWSRRPVTGLVALNAREKATPYFTAAPEHSLKSVGTRIRFSAIILGLF